MRGLLHHPGAIRQHRDANAIDRGMLIDAVTQTGRSTAMATPRSMIVDEAVTSWYHCTSHCVRRAFLCGDGKGHRKARIEDRLRGLVGVFAIDCAGYIDLNPPAAGVASVPEAGPHTSLHARVEQARAEGTLEAAVLEAAGEGGTPPPPTAEAASGPVAAPWLLPTDDRSGRPGGRPGLAAGLTPGGYLRLVDRAARLARDGEARMDPDAASILRRPRIDAPTWRATVARSFDARRPAGGHLGGPARPGEAAREHNRRWHRNLSRRIARPAVPAA